MALADANHVTLDVAAPKGSRLRFEAAEQLGD
jgi:hypothetical protein